jgi:predicted DNA-binding protein
MIDDAVFESKKTYNETKHTSYRLPPQIKSKLKTLSAVDGITDTETLKRLINADYKARQQEIKIFRENQKSKES